MLYKIRWVYKNIVKINKLNGGELYKKKGGV